MLLVLAACLNAIKKLHGNACKAKAEPLCIPSPPRFPPAVVCLDLQAANEEAFLAAAGTGQVELLQQQLSKAAPPSAYLLERSLLKACEAGHVDVVQLLLQAPQNAPRANCQVSHRLSQPRVNPLSLAR